MPRSWTKTHGGKRCERILAIAVKRGRLQPARTFNCTDCGAPAVCYDHRDYNKPLDVQPVCHKCNVNRGAAIPWDGTPWKKFMPSKLYGPNRPRKPRNTGGTIYPDRGMFRGEVWVNGRRYRSKRSKTRDGVAALLQQIIATALAEAA